ncbi:MAG: hypothetical protein J4428_02120 [Candidatus Aenigmarchaeota archaeon]|nr:hypothetical protein [Candidatus Aenigmarchaeota archaeon]
MLKKSEDKKGKCTCSFLHLLIALLLMSLGLFLVLGGVGVQFSGGWSRYTSVLPLYFFGLLLLVVGKFVKRLSYCNCSAHGCM